MTLDSRHNKYLRDNRSRLSFHPFHPSLSRYLIADFESQFGIVVDDSVHPHIAILNLFDKLHHDEEFKGGDPLSPFVPPHVAMAPSSNDSTDSSFMTFTRRRIDSC
jgi:hypothetical protein